MLQFGHSNEAVDNPSVCQPCPNTSMPLQFGHSNEAVDNTTRPNCKRGQCPQLQFGHSNEAVDNRLPPWQPAGTWDGFNSATAMKLWITQRIDVGPHGLWAASIRPQQ